MNNYPHGCKTCEENGLAIHHIREYLKVMKDEPDEYILLSKVYHDLKRILGDEE